MWCSSCGRVLSGTCVTVVVMAGLAYVSHGTTRTDD